MESETEGGATESDLEREIDMGRGAIRMVALGHYPSVTIASLRWGPQALETLRPEASRVGVTLVPLEAVGGGTDLRAQREERRPGQPR
jgi:hypothetical protein